MRLPLFAMLLLPFAARAAEPATCAAVRFVDIGWLDVTVTTALTSNMLRHLGYAPRVTTMSVPNAFRALHDGAADVFLGNWMPAMAADRAPYDKDGSIEVLGRTLRGARYTLAVPKSVWDAGLRDFADIARFGPQLDWKIWGIEPGQSGNLHVQRLIDGNRFGLGRFTQVEGNEQTMLAAVEKAFWSDRPIVFQAWEPHPMNHQYPIRYLSGGDDTFGPDFGAGDVFTVARAGYAAQCPNAARLLRNMAFDAEMEAAVMEDILSRDRRPAQAAAAWLEAHPDAGAKWLEGVSPLQ